MWLCNSFHYEKRAHDESLPSALNHVGVEYKTELLKRKVNHEYISGVYRGTSLEQGPLPVRNHQLAHKKENNIQ